MASRFLKSALFFMAPGMISFASAGTIQGVFCEDSSFVVVASPDAETQETCVLNSSLTINGVTDEPRNDLITEPNTRIDLRKMAPGDIASVSFTLECIPPTGDTITEDNDEDTTSDCLSVGEIRRQLAQGGLSRQQTRDLNNLLAQKRGAGTTTPAPTPTFTAPRGRFGGSRFNRRSTTPTPSGIRQFTPGVSITPSPAGVFEVNGVPSTGGVPVGLSPGPSLNVLAVPASIRREIGQRRREQFIICNANPNSQACRDATNSFNRRRAEVAAQFLN